MLPRQINIVLFWIVVSFAIIAGLIVALTKEGELIVRLAGAFTTLLGIILGAVPQLRKLLLSDDSNLNRPGKEQENRKYLIDKMQKVWVTGVLNDTLRDAAFTVDVEGAPSHVATSPIGGYGISSVAAKPALSAVWDVDLKILLLDEPPKPDKRTIAQIYSDVGEQLLILGEAGSGKTVLLLQLAEQLLGKATPDNGEPIPIVLNLSSWAVKRGTLANWILAELQNPLYQMPKYYARRFIRQNKLVFLLDGLDEVPDDYRADCVEAINQFITEDSHVVICSRMAEYEAVKEKLKTHTAIQVQPLTENQFISKLQPHLEPQMVTNILQVLKSDAAVWEEVNKPLFINILISTYRRRPVTALPSVSGDVPQQIRKLVIEPYIKQQLKNPPIEAPEQDMTRYYLGWLGWQMQNREKVFYIEQLQTDWLPKPALWLLRGLWVGMFALCVGLSIGLLGDISLEVTSDDGSTIQLSYSWVIQLIFGLILGLFLGLRVINLERKLQLRLPNLSEVLHSLRDGVLVGSTAGLLVGLATGIIGASFGIQIGAVPFGGLREVLDLGLGGILLGGSLGAVTGVIVGVFRAMVSGDTPTAQRFYANQGLRNTLYFGLFFGTISGLLFSTFLMLLGREFRGVLMCVCVLIGWLIGIAPVIKHLLLRGVLWQQGVAPRRYDKFLSYVCDRRIMRRVGGGFTFNHRYILEYFGTTWETRAGRSQSLS